MKNPVSRSSRTGGFSLMELMVAMAITSIIVVALVSITSMALDVWNRSRAELRASRQAKAMIEVMSKDFEAMVSRRGNTNEWLFAKVEPTLPGDHWKSSNAAQVVFFSAATDRYEGKIGTTDDKGGDVSTIGYELKFRDAFDPDDGGSKNKNYIFNRYLVDPKETFEKLLGQPDIETVFTPVKDGMAEEKYFVCENIFQFSFTFNVQVTKTGTNPTVINVPLVLSDGDGVKEIHIKGDGITLGASDSPPSGVTADELKSGRLASVEVSLTVLSDGVVNLSNRRAPTEKERLQGTFQYSKVIQVPSP